jgi:hypothetical protein
VIDTAIVTRFHAAQVRLLHSTYDEAWHQGVANFTPRSRLRESESAQQERERHEREELILTGAVGAGALLLLRRQKPYRPPAAPEPKVRARALTPALRGLDRMAGELQAVVPTADTTQRAEAAVGAGTIRFDEAAGYALALAAEDWLDSNAWRLDAGESVAWAGEQAGYAQAADAGGELLEWVPEADDKVCDDCLDLGALPPMPLSDWPTTPGEGATVCNVGCRCVLQASDVQVGEGEELPPLSGPDEETLDRIAAKVTEPIEAEGFGAAARDVERLAKPPG